MHVTLSVAFASRVSQVTRARGCQDTLVHKGRPSLIPSMPSGNVNSFSHRTCTALSLLVLCASLPGLGADKGVVEGYVRNQNGQPAKGVWLSITTVAEKEHPQTLVVPIITKSTVGVIGAQFPPVTLPLWDNFFVKVDKHGHYRVPVPTKYTLYQMTANCCSKGLFGHEAGGSVRIRL